MFYRFDTAIVDLRNPAVDGLMLWQLKKMFGTCIYVKKSTKTWNFFPILYKGYFIVRVSIEK